MWQKFSLTAPASAEALHSTLHGRAGALANAVTQGAGAVAGLGLPSGGGGAVPERAALESLLRGAPAFLALTPYTSGVRQGDKSSLTPAGALALLQNHLAGFSGANAAALMLLVPGEDESLLNRALVPLCAIWPQPELMALLRRSGGLATLEIDKFVIPAAPAWPPARAAAPVECPIERELYELIGTEVAIAEAVAGAGETPAKKLVDFAAKRAAGVAALAAAYEALAASLTGEFDFYAAYLSGSGLGQIGALGKSAPVAERYKVCSALCWWGPAESLTFLKELFGV